MRILAVSDTPIHVIPYRNARPGGTVTAELPILSAEVDRLPSGVDAILATSDLQGREALPGIRLLGEVVAEECDRLAATGVLPAADRIGVVLAGDFYSDPMAGLRGSSGDVISVWGAFGGRFRWVAGVPGNHDELHEFETSGGGYAPANVHLLDGRDVMLGEMRIAGLGGIIGKPNKLHRRSEAEYRRAIHGLLKRQPEMLILHETPGIAEERLRGSAIVREGLDEAPGVLAVVGHCHWPTPLITLANGVQVLNVDSRLVILRGRK